MPYLEMCAVPGLIVFADKVLAVIFHQVANYGMGGQYEPHFDFSRVSPNHRYKTPTHGSTSTSITRPPSCPFHLGKVSVVGEAKSGTIGLWNPAELADSLA